MGLNETPSGERITIGFFGRCNVGKSSVVNAVTGQDLAVVSQVSGTTTDPVSKAMEILPLGPVMIIDTPGFGSFEVDSMESEELKNYFPEFRAFEGMCRFSGCNHIAEPDCAVKNAVKEKIVSKSRHNSYKKLFEELKATKKW